MLKEASYPIAPKGFSTLPEQDVSQDMCLQFRNMFTNIAGNAEKRQGLVQYGSTVSTRVALNNLHEFITPQGTTLKFTSGNGQIWRHNDDGTFTQVFTFATPNAKVFSMSLAGKFIFYNGVDRNVYTTDGTTFNSLLSLLRVGTGTGGTDASNLFDTTVTDWTVANNITRFSIVYFPAVSAYGMVTNVSADQIHFTPVSAAGTGIGVGTAPTTGTYYQIMDTLQVNIIPVSGIPNLLVDNDNLASGSSTTRLKLSAVSDFTNTQIRSGDWVFNSARNTLTSIVSVAPGYLDVVPVASQAANDRIYLMKSSQPITYYGAVHFNRTYNIDARDRQHIRISGPGDPQDFGSDLAASLDVSTFQTKSDRLVTLGSFQRFFVIGTSQHIYVYQGTDPVGTSAAAIDFTLQGFFPFGTLSRQAMAGVGNDLHIATINGIRNITLSKVAAVFLDNTTSYQIDRTLRELLKNLGRDSPEDIQMFYYPKRSWVVLKAGSEMYVYNFVTQKPSITSITDIYYNMEAFKPVWHLFDGKLANQSGFLVAEDGQLYTCGGGGVVSQFDQGNYDDLGDPIETVYETGWLSLEKSAKSVIRKHGKALKCVMQVGSDFTVTIGVEAPYAKYSTDQIILTTKIPQDIVGEALVGTALIGGNAIDFTKIPLRWHGEVCKLKFETASTEGPFILSNFTIYYTSMAPE